MPEPTPCMHAGVCQEPVRWAVSETVADEDGQRTYHDGACLAHLHERLHEYEVWADTPEAQHDYAWTITVTPWVPEPEPQPEPECVHGLSLWLCADPVNHYPPDNYPF